MARKDELVYAEVVLRSRTGASLIEHPARITADALRLYEAAEDSPDEVSGELERAGFRVLAASRFGVSIVGTRELIEGQFSTKIVDRPVVMFFGGGQTREGTGFFMDEPPRLPTPLSALAETVYIPQRGYFLAGEGAMPTTSYYALRPPNDIVQLTNADHAHSRGFRGSGVKVSMVDSGFIANHDYYNGRGYNLTVHAAVGSTTQDEYGHGTAIAANLLAIAPDCDFHFYKMSDGTNWAALAGFRMARLDNPRVITCSWGQGYDAVLEAEIQTAVAAGITVIFACGNGGPVGWPGCMPEVISVGGAYPRQDGSWEASTYASSGTNALHPNRHCPDLSAIVGQAPKGIFIVMPTMQDAIFDGSFGGGTFPTGDETGASDGWMVASGTSSAAPMVAGASALMLNARSSLTPAEVRQALESTCVDVISGASASGEAAGIGPDSATGAGRIDIGAAVDDVAPPRPCLTAPIQICRVAPLRCRLAPLQCVRGPNVCRRAPLVDCVRAPIVRCTRAPLVQCVRAPIIECLRAPTLRCTRAPLVDCLRAPQPIPCATAPLGGCAVAPVQGCLAGPWKHDPRIPGDPVRPPERGRLVPVVVMVDEREAAEWMAEDEEYLAAIGMEEEYQDFPEAEGCARGPFDPTAKG